MKRRVVPGLVLLALWGCGGSEPDAELEPEPEPIDDVQPEALAGFLQAQGTGFVVDGRPYRMKGLDIYNANSVDNCWYNLGAGDRLQQAMSRMGTAANTVRAWFFQSLAQRGGMRDFSVFDHTLAVARARGLKVVVTLGNQWGDCETAGYRGLSWYQGGYRGPDPGMLRSYRDWVAEVVTRYRDRPEVAMWQLMNEAEASPGRGLPCTAAGAAALKAFAQDLAQRVKGIDRRHLLSLGTIGAGQCGTSWTEYQDLHAIRGIDVCEYHDYGSKDVVLPGDSWNGLKTRIDQCRALGKPIFVGETGITGREAGGLAARAAAFDRKLGGQFGSGVGGELIWDYCDPAYGPCNSDTNYDVTPGDPTLLVLARY